MLTAMTLSCALSASPIAAGFYGLPIVLRRMEERRLRFCCARSRTLVLTYDDGPGSASTPPLLDLLAEHDATATFFITGFRALEHPALVDRIASEGHEIGCHSHHHLHAWRSAPWRTAADVAQGYRTLAGWIQPDGLYRPPYGKCDAWTWWQVKRRGAPMAWWTVDSGDADDDLPPTSPAIERLRREGGGVVLLHDFDRDTRRIDFMLQTTRQLLQTARQEGWRVRSFGELLEVLHSKDPDLHQCPAAA